MREDDERHGLLEIVQEVPVGCRPWSQVVRGKFNSPRHVGVVALPDELNELEPKERKVQLRVRIKYLMLG